MVNLDCTPLKIETGVQLVIRKELEGDRQNILRMH